MNSISVRSLFSHIAGTILSSQGYQVSVSNSETFFKRYQLRKYIEVRNRRIVFGLVTGVALLMWSSFQYYVVVSEFDTEFRYLQQIALTITFLAIAYPQIYAVPEKLFSSVTQVLGKSFFSLLLILIYFLVVTPLGIVFRTLRNRTFSYSWMSSHSLVSSDKLSFWFNKDCAVYEGRQVLKRKKPRSVFSQFFLVLHYFISNGKFLLLPVVLIAMLLGTLMFFLQTSSLAPFIYTLF